MQGRYEDIRGNLYWNGIAKMTAVTMEANGYKSFANFTVGVDGTYIKNDRMYVEESLLWQIFGKVIDPPAKIRTPIDELKENPWLAVGSVAAAPASGGGSVVGGVAAPM